jgi:hypothetical protein
MKGPVVLALRCPRCGTPLHGLQQDVVFWCEGCQVPHEVVGETFVERRGSAARAVLPSKQPVLHLPVWAMRVAYACHWDDPERAALARQVPSVDWVYVTGFELHNASYFGDPGMIFTEKRVRLEAAGPTLVVGCSRSLEEAKAYVEPRLLAVIDRRVDVTGLEMSCVIHESVLWGVPYVDEGDALRDGILGWKIPAAAVDEVSAIRRCLGAGR